MARTLLTAGVLLLVLTVARPAAAEEVDTFLRASVRTDLSGRTELVIHKAYKGQLGPIRDMISLQSPGPDGYPKVEILTSGAVRATREYGRVVVESTGPGPGEVDLFVTVNGMRSTWFLQWSDTPGVGAVRLNASASFGDGLHTAKEGNQVTVRSAEGPVESIIGPDAHPMGWTADSTIPAGKIVILEVAGEPDRVAPLWLARAGLGLALTALALSGYLGLQLRRVSARE